MQRQSWRTSMSKIHSVKEDDFVDGICVLAKNTPKLVSPKYNELRFKIHEDSTKETLYIVFKLNDGEKALIGRECHKPKKDRKEPARTDLMCVYSKPTHAIGYAYDLKKTLGGKDVILDLLSQWTETISYCKTQIHKADYEFVVGVITEKFDQQLLNSGIIELSKLVEESDDSDFKYSLAARKRNVSIVNNRKSFNRLIDFRSGRFKIEDLVLDIDIHYFESTGDKNELTLQFNGDGKPQDLRFAVHTS